jgi:hypothetical protein
LQDYTFSLFFFFQIFHFKCFIVCFLLSPTSSSVHKMWKHYETSCWICNSSTKRAENSHRIHKILALLLRRFWLLTVAYISYLCKLRIASMALCLDKGADRNSSGQLLDFHCPGSISIPEPSMLDLLWAKWQWVRILTKHKDFSCR